MELDLSDFEMTEAMIIAFSQRGAWSGEREHLTQTEMEQLRTCISHELVWSETKLRHMLDHIFANFYHEILAARSFKDAGKFPGRPKFIRDNLVKLLTLIDEGQEGGYEAIEKALSQLNNQEDGKVVLYFMDFLAAQFPKGKYPRSLALRRDGMNSSLIVKFRSLVVFSKAVAAQNVKPGGNGDAFYKQMCITLASLYYDATGVTARRHYDEINKTDTGPLHRLTETLAVIIDAHLPSHLPKEARKFPRMCTDVIKDFDAELSLKTT